MKSDHEYHSLTVADVIDETGDTRSFVLDIPADLAEAFAYQAGQFGQFHGLDIFAIHPQSFRVSPVAPIGLFKIEDGR